MATLADAPPRPRVESRAPPRGRWALAAVVLVGLASELIYLLALVRPYFLPRYVDRRLLDLGKIGGYAIADGSATGRRWRSSGCSTWLPVSLAAGWTGRSSRSPTAARSSSR